ncbi:MAG: flagellar biosynthetic protein FliR [Candidatus Latescibacterota bacterium]|nr:flagellar biosynthetic protein FliR [Candidatus Latescibacterota bacterium]
MQHWLDQFHIYLLVLLRVSALLTVAPIFGHRNYLARGKIGLALMISFVVFPMVAEQPLDIPEGLLAYALMLMREIVMGLILGFVVLMLFVGIHFAGQLAGLQMGFGIVNVIDPQSTDQISIIGQFLNILAILLLFALNGHHVILSGLVGSFQAIPLGGVVLSTSVLQKILALTSDVFIIAVKIAAPMLVALFLVTASMGVLARTVPQMNVFMVGFPVQIFVGISVLLITLPLFAILLERLIFGLHRDLFALLDFMH